MPNRAPSTINRVADGVLEIFRKNVEDHPDKWFMIPRSWERGVGPQTIGLSDPVFCVSLNGDSRPIAQRLMGYGQSETTITVTIFGRHSRADYALGEMLADLWRVVMENRQLTGVDDPDNPTLLAGFIAIGNTKMASVSNPTLGEFTIEQEIVVNYTWSSSAP
jgi:hypothetical protein